MASRNSDVQHAQEEHKSGTVEVSPETDSSKPAAVASNGNELDNGLQRGLKNRHLVMISFGGVVGASIWYGVGFAVAYSGPLGAIICFFIIGVDVFFVMQCLGEMSTLFPIQGMYAVKCEVLYQCD